MNTDNTFNPHEWLDVKGTEAERPAPAIASGSGGEASDIEMITSRIEEARVDITSSYANWRDLGFALSDALGENGRDYFQRLSRFHPEYSAIEADRQYDRCLKAGGHGITIKTFYQLAKAHGISLVTRSMPVRERTSYTSVRRAEGIEVSEGMRASMPPSTELYSTLMGMLLTTLAAKKEEMPKEATVPPTVSGWERNPPSVPVMPYLSSASTKMNMEMTKGARSQGARMTQRAMRKMERRRKKLMAMVNTTSDTKNRQVMSHMGRFRKEDTDRRMMHPPR